MRTPGPLRRLEATVPPSAVAFLAAVVLVAAGFVHLDRVEVAATADAPDRGPSHVGPATGVDLERYVTARHDVLRSVAAEAPADPLRAIVSFARPVPVRALPVPEAVTVEHVHVVLPGETEPRELPAVGAADRLAALLADGREDLDAEIAELEALLAEDVDDAFAAEFDARVDELRNLRDRADADAALVVAAVVVAPAADLVDLVATAPVRAVDPGGSPERTVHSRFSGVPPDVLDPTTTGRGAPAVPAP